MALTKAHARMIEGSPVNVKDFGAVGDGVTDDTAAIQAAITYCKANNKSLYSGSENNHFITSQIDLRSVKGVLFNCTISHATDDFIPVVIGHESTQLFEYTFNINRIVWTNQPGSGETKSNLATNPQLRIVGLKNAYIFVGSVDYIQLYADSDDPTTQSTAYNTIQIILSYLVEFDTNPSPSGSTIQWINGNKFLPGRIQRITMDGTYSHNNNIFYAQEMETNGEITLTTGFSNKFYDFRFEGTGITVTFGTGHNNYVRQSYAEVNYSSVGLGSPTVTQGTGAANIFIRDYEQFIDKVVMFGLSNGETVDGIQKNFYQQYVDKSGDQWDANSTFTTIFETDYIPCVAGIGFNFESDQTMWRPKVTFYDASLSQITSASDPELLDGQVLTWSSVSNAYVIASDISEIDALMVTATSGYFKVEVVTGSTLPAFDYVNLIGYCPKGHNGEALAAMSPKYKSGLISVTAAEIADATNAINTTDKYAGKQVWVSNAFKTVFAAANLATSTWRYSDGTTAYTPS